VQFRAVALDKLQIEDERSFRHVALYDELKQRLRRDAYCFRVPSIEDVKGHRPVHRTDILFLNLVFWDAAGEVDVLDGRSVSADVLMHAAWHHVTRAHLVKASVPPCADGLFLGESIASAFDIYLVGRLLGHAPESELLENVVPAMADAAEASGVSAADFESLLEGVALDPDRAFIELRELLFDATTELLGCTSVDSASATLERLRARRFGPLLHYFELSNWILYARAHGNLQPDSRVRAIDAALRTVTAPLDWLEHEWVLGEGAGSERERADERSGQPAPRGEP
jgi:hypothetical protein